MHDDIEHTSMSFGVAATVVNMLAVHLDKLSFFPAQN
jgi:hypothetical protein